MKNSIARVVVSLPVQGHFDYLIPKSLQSRIKTGSRVQVPFRNSKIIGYVIGLSKSSKIKKLRAIINALDNECVLDARSLKFFKNLSDYYCCAWAEMIEAGLPRSFRKAKSLSLRRVNSIAKAKNSKDKSKITLAYDQSSSKKWDYLISEIKKARSLNKGIICLVPEIFYIDETVRFLKDKLGEYIAALHSHENPQKELAEWLKIKQGQVKIVVGTRLAVFAPVLNLGLIIVSDEESEFYKQEQSPFYHARHVAIERARHESADAILVSEAPSLDSYYHYSKGDYELIELVNDIRPLAKIEIVDMNRQNFFQNRIRKAISSILENEIQKTCSESGRVILFFNRVGFATLLRCKACGFILKCDKCSAGLTYHYNRKLLICRYCNKSTPPVEICPHCKGSYISYSGMGTEKLESELHRIIPHARIQLLDKDANLLSNDFDILITTRIILKKQIKCDLIGILQLDTILNRIDFRSSEEVHELLIKLSKLAKKKVIIQTRNPQHPSIESVLNNDSKIFYSKELNQRKELGFPPYRHFVSIQLRSKKESSAKETAFSLCQLFKEKKARGISILDPHPGIPSRLRGTFRWNILLQGKSVLKINSLIQGCLSKLKHKAGTLIHINVDV